MKFTNNWLSLAFILISAGFTSCSDDKDSDDPMVLPPGEYPVTFMASIEQHSRASLDNAWSGNEAVTVQSVAEDATFDNAETALYTTDAQGNMTSGTPFYWTRRDESRKVRAWYLGNGTKQSTVPTSWQVPADQSTGLQNADMLYAYGVVTFDGSHNLTFHHQTSKITVNIKQTGTAAASTSITSVTIGNGDIALSGALTLPTDNETRISWIPDAAASSVTPMTLEPNDGYTSKIAAILIPQDITGKTLLNITLSDGTVLTHMRQETTVLLSGYQYTFDATVNHDLKVLDVKLTSSSTWADGGNHDVASTEPDNDYGEVKIGDYYYSDGSWSDGGFLGFNTQGNGSLNWASPKPAPTATNPITGKPRHVIGIVFQTDPSRIGEAEKEALRAKGTEPHGLVMATRTYYAQWDIAAHDETEIGLPSYSSDTAEGLYALLNADISGYNVARTIMSKRANDFAAGNYPMLAFATNQFAEAVGGPTADAKTTGWYIPSAGQIFDMIRNFSGLDFSEKPEYFYAHTSQNKVTGFNWQRDKYLSFMEKYPEKLVDLINFTTSQVDTQYKNDFQEANYIVASFVDKEWIFCMPVYQFYVSCEPIWKTNNQQARCVLAF